MIFVGYTAYIGYLLLEHQHANPILQVFVRLLAEDEEIKNQNRNSKTLEVDLEETCKLIAHFHRYVRSSANRLTASVHEKVIHT